MWLEAHRTCLAHPAQPAASLPQRRAQASDIWARKRWAFSNDWSTSRRSQETTVQREARAYHFTVRSQGFVMRSSRGSHGSGDFTSGSGYETRTIEEKLVGLAKLWHSVVFWRCLILQLHTSYAAAMPFKTTWVMLDRHILCSLKSYTLSFSPLSSALAVWTKRRTNPHTLYSSGLAQLHAWPHLPSS